MRTGAGTASRALSIAGMSAGAGLTDSPRSERLTRALALLWLVFLVYPLATIIGMVRLSHGTARWLPPAIVLAALGALYACAVWRGSSISRWRGAWPTVAALGALGLLVPLAFGADWFGGFLYACVVAAMMLPVRRAVGAIVVFAALTLLLGGVLGVVWWETIALTLLTGLAGGVMLGVTWLQATNAELHAARMEIARLAATEERQRLARDLHDSVKQQVFITAMEIGAARALLERDPQAAATHLSEANASIRQAQSELTALIRQPDPTPHATASLAASVRAYVEDWSRRTGIVVEQQLAKACAPPPPVREAFYRVAREALANTARHSQATAAGVTLETSGTTLTLRVWDNGRGFALAALPSRGESGYGLRSMRERIEAVGGSFAIESAPGKGTRISCVYRECGAADTRGKEGQRA